MRVAWVTPLARASAIGAVSVAVAEELHRFVDVELIHPRTRDPIATAIPTTIIGDGEAQHLEEFDAVCYSMGDNCRFHGEIHALSQKVPGVVVLHDVGLHHLFADLWLREGGTEKYVSKLQEFTDVATAAAAREHLDATSRWDWTPQSPELVLLLEPALIGALGVITHTEFASSRVRERFEGPVATIPLPVRPDLPRARRADGTNRVVATSLGHVNRNRNVDLVIRAIGGSPILRESISYAVVGACDHRERERLVRLIADLDLGDVVALRGSVDDAGLLAALRESEIGVNLRFAAGEAASMSQLEEMGSGLAVIVIDDGHYADLPSDAVVKLEQPPSCDAIASALEQLVTDPQRRREIGDRARGYVLEVHRPDRYARAVLDFLTGPVAQEKPTLLLIDDLGDAMQRVGGRDSDIMVHRVSRIVEGLFFEEAATAGTPSTSAAADPS